jgi:hypothetical protein
MPGSVESITAGWLMLLGGVFMLAGVALHLAENHGHEHTHT